MKPWLAMFRMRFSPMTARPIRPMSAFSLHDSLPFLIGIIDITELMPLLATFAFYRPWYRLCSALLVAQPLPVCNSSMRNALRRHGVPHRKRDRPLQKKKKIYY